MICTIPNKKGIYFNKYPFLEFLPLSLRAGGAFI